MKGNKGKYWENVDVEQFMKRCMGCKNRIWIFQKRGVNDYWHYRCWKSWELGYDASVRFVEQELRIAGMDSPYKLYKERTLRGYA